MEDAPPEEVGTERRGRRVRKVVKENLGDRDNSASESDEKETKETTEQENGGATGEQKQDKDDQGTTVGSKRKVSSWTRAWQSDRRIEAVGAGPGRLARTRVADGDPHQIFSAAGGGGDWQLHFNAYSSLFFLFTCFFAPLLYYI